MEVSNEFPLLYVRQIYLGISRQVAKLNIASNSSCYANLQLSRAIKTIVNLHGMTCCYA